MRITQGVGAAVSIENVSAGASFEHLRCRCSKEVVITSRGNEIFNIRDRILVLEGTRRAGVIICFTHMHAVKDAGPRTRQRHAAVIQHIRPCSAIDRVIAKAADDGIGSIGAIDGVVPGGAGEWSGDHGIGPAGPV